MMVVAKQSSRHKMWTEITRGKYEREGQRYASDLTDAEWALIEPHMPAVKRLGRPRETELRSVLDAILYIARTCCQWRMLPKDFPPSPRCKVIFTIGETAACSRRSISSCCCKPAKRRAAKRARRPGSSTLSRSRRPRAAGRGGTTRPRRSRAASATLLPTMAEQTLKVEHGSELGANALEPHK